MLEKRRSVASLAYHRGSPPRDQGKTRAAGIAHHQRAAQGDLTHA